METSSLNLEELLQVIDIAKDRLFRKASNFYKKKLKELIKENAYQNANVSPSAVYCFTFGGFMITDPDVDSVANRKQLRNWGLVPLHDSLIPEYLNLIKLDEKIKKDRSKFDTYTIYISTVGTRAECVKCLPSKLTDIAEENSEAFKELLKTKPDLNKYVTMLKNLCHTYLAYELIT